MLQKAAYSCSHSRMQLIALGVLLSHTHHNLENAEVFAHCQCQMINISLQNYLMLTSFMFVPHGK